MHQVQSSPHRFTTLLVLLLTALTLPLAGLCHAEDREVPFTEGTTLLIQGDFEQKGDAIDKIATSGDKRAKAILQALLDGNLYQIKKDNILVYAAIEGSQADITAALSGEPLGSVKKRKLKKSPSTTACAPG